ncbi:MAG: hypothetical protein KatS3mg113_0566 [Planctomycetaceae bacterium]|nr:MAG: hypothetical protein KatS3mg113_0566 [Planctomycetaceae bacterium]
MNDKFRELIREIQRRKGGLPSYQELNFFIVSSLAGGTGRGSWELIAFKLRQLFQEYDRQASPVAFLYDASIFLPVWQRSPHQKIPLMVNALTGISQLSCWVKHREPGHIFSDARYEYHLPHMEHPRDIELDVLKVDLELDVNNLSPVDHAYLIFRENPHNELGEIEPYYEMTAAGIYATLSKSVIDRQKINQTQSYLGLAAATVEVNAVALRKFFEARSRLLAVQLLQQNQKQNQSQATQEACKKFWEETRLLIDVTADDPFSHYKSDDQGTLLQRVIRRLEIRLQPRLRKLEATLADQDRKAAEDSLKALLQQDEKSVREVFGEVWQECTANFDQVISNIIDKLLEQTQSLACVRFFLEHVVEGLKVEIEEMPSELPPEEISPEQLLIDYSKGWWPFTIYDEDERKQILEATRRSYPRRQYIVLKSLLEEHYKRLIERVSAWRDNASKLLHILMQLLHYFQKQVDQADGCGSSSEKIEERLFCPPAKPEAGLLELYSHARFYRRNLKPLLDESEIDALLSPVVRLEGQLLKILKKYLTTPENLAESSQQVRKELEQVIQTSVGITSEFIKEHFSLRKVLKKIRYAWQQRFQKKMNSDQRYDLENRFEQMFGLRPQAKSVGDEPEYELPEDVDDLLCAMGASLADNCIPFVKMSRRANLRKNVMLFVPSQLDKESLQAKVKEHLRNKDINIEVHPESPADDDSTDNPYLLLAYSTQGVCQLEDIDSLSYYKTAGVLEILRSAEKENGESIFTEQGNGGLGYTDPLYVRELRVRTKRWRPWHQDHDASPEEVQRENDALDVLLYALFPGDPSAGSLLASITRQAAERGWQMPVLSPSGRSKSLKHYKFLRGPLLWVEKRAIADTNRHGVELWEEGKSLAKSAGLQACLDVLLEKVDDTKRSEQGARVRARLLQESHTFWQEVLREFNLAPGLPAYRKLQEEYLHWIWQQVQSFGEEAKEREVWQRLHNRWKRLMAADPQS